MNLTENIANDKYVFIYSVKNFGGEGEINFLYIYLLQIGTCKTNSFVNKIIFRNKFCHNILVCVSIISL